MVFVSEFFFRNSIRKAACQPTAETALHIKLRLQYWGMFVVAPDPNLFMLSVTSNHCCPYPAEEMVFQYIHYYLCLAYHVTLVWLVE